MLWPGRFSSTGDPGPEFSATAVSGQRTESGDGGNRAVEHRLSGAGDNGVAKYRQAERRIPASVPCSAWMGAHQPDRRLRLASEPEERRGAISAATNAGKTSLFSPIQATCPKAPCAPSSGKPASRSTPSSVPICRRQRKDRKSKATFRAVYGNVCGLFEAVDRPACGTCLPSRGVFVVLGTWVGVAALLCSRWWSRTRLPDPFLILVLVVGHDVGRRIGVVRFAGGEVTPSISRAQERAPGDAGADGSCRGSDADCGVDRKIRRERIFAPAPPGRVAWMRRAQSAVVIPVGHVCGGGAAPGSELCRSPIKIGIAQTSSSLI